MGWQRRLAGPRAYLLLALLGSVVFLPWLGTRDLWNPDEPRYAEVAREMRLSGDWLVPRYNGEIYTQKPPLFFWAINLAASATGALDETAVRLPSALGAIATVLLTFAMGRRLLDESGAWIAALAVGANLKVLWQGRFGQIDMFLTALVAAAMLCFLVGLLDRRPGFYWLFFLFAGLATLTKGPVGFLPPLLSVVVFLLVSSRRDELRRLRVGRGVLLWAGVVALWLLSAAAVAGREYLYELVFTQNLTRFLGAGGAAITTGHLRPWYHYLTTIPVDFLPWSLLLPAAFWVGWREGARRKDVGFTFAVCWVVTTVLFLSLSSGKRSVYLLPIFPGLALLVAHWIGLARRTWPRHRLAVSLPLWLLGALSALAAVAVFSLPRFSSTRVPPEVEEIGPAVAVVAAWLAALAVAAAAAALLIARHRELAAVRTLAATMAVLGPIGLGWIAPRADSFKSARRVADTLEHELAPGEPWASYREAKAGVLFYLEQFAVVLPDEPALRRFAQRGPGRWVVADRDDLTKVSKPFPYQEVVGSGRTAGGLVLLRARPEAVP